MPTYNNITKTSPVTITGNTGVTFTSSGAVRISSSSKAAVTNASNATGSLVNSGTVYNTIGTGVSLTNANYVTNGASALIYGGSYGIITNTLADTIGNSGTIIGSTNYGIALQAGGYVSNATNSTIRGRGGITAASASTILNSGLISGASKYGIALQSGGQVTNATNATISGFADAIDATGSSTVANSGLITGSSHNGIGLLSGGQVTNATGATIRGGTDGVFAGGSIASEVTNSGTITGSSLAGIDLAAGGQVTNASGATISGSSDGVVASGSIASTVVNSGRITGSTDSGVRLQEGGQVINNGTGAIYGVNTGVYIGGTAGDTNVVTNLGTISGATYAVYFEAGYTDLLTIDPGASFSGTVDGGNTIGSAFVSTLELASGATAGTLAGLGSKYVNFAQTTIDANATWTLGGSNTLVTRTALTNAGTLTLASATLTDSGALTNNGVILLDPSTLTAASLTGTGQTTIGASGKLEVQGVLSSGETVAFSGSNALLKLDAPISVAGTLTAFAQQQTIDLAGVLFNSVTYNAHQLQFTLSDGVTSGSIALTLANGGSVQAVSDGAGGAFVTALCFCAGACVATPNGEVPVEQLAVGEMVRTASGAVRPISWIGTGRVLATRGKRGPATPVIVRKGALADNVPHRDLRVTKGHALFIDDVLIPVEFLVNHRSIVWDDRAQEVAIYHIELSTHDVLLVDGAPAESYRDDGNRWLFQNANTGWALTPQEPCAPVLTGGPVVDTAWCRLLDRAGPRPGLPVTNDADLHLLVDGYRLGPAERVGEAYVFRLSALPSELRIASRAAAPDELGLARDPRLLGVALRQIKLWQGRHVRVIEADDTRLSQGFHAFEAGSGLRWTDGNALLPASLFEGVVGPCELELRVGCTTRYVVSQDGVRAAA